jgi:2-polyprenyl-3-methyl-5-hydroxy-6-metoxy-1,4-benzoquinol methylase
VTTPPSINTEKHLEWTPEFVARFWDHWANSPELHDQYFTFQVGEAIANFLSCVSNLRGLHILDYGCGPGFLEEHLLRLGARVTAADYSPETVKSVNARFSKYDGWEGAGLISDGAILAPESSFDIITCIETIEHMFEPDRKKMLIEFRRILKPGGYLMVTTPNEENLQRNSILCPSCNYLFHMMQHLHSWNQSSLTAVLKDAGLDVKFCGGVHLTRWMPHGRKKMIDYSIRNIKDAVSDAYRNVADRMFPRPFPNGRSFRRLLQASNEIHLVAIATKH